MADNTLGEKLRQAREERGLSLSEVADQTRISSLYLESIENDDYRILPGGIFNKGFVKSYAKFVGINEQEALQDYARLVAETQVPAEEEVRSYRPEVLTDDRTSGSMVPTVITAVIILGLMTAGILFLINYLRQPAEPAADLTANTNTTTNANVPPSTNAAPPEESGVPELGTAKLEFSATTDPVSLTSVTDGKSESNIVAAGSAVVFEPKESIKLSYSRSLAKSVQLTINGKQIALPQTPFNPRRNVIEFEINKDNLASIWTNASIVTESNETAPTETPVQETTPAPEANPAATSAQTPPPAAATPVRTPARPPATPRPAANKTAPAANKPAPNTSPRRVITVPSANRPDQ